MSSTMDSAAGTGREELKKTMSPAEVWALAVGAIIGWGCFILPGTRFLPEAGPLATCLAFLIGGGLLCFVALSYGILIKAYPVAGGSFTYAYVGFGTKAGFICGWALVLGYLCVIAANGTAMALLTRFLLPGVFDVGYLYSVAGWDIYAGELCMMSAVFLFFGYMNYRGMDFASSLQLILAFALAGGVLVLALGTFSAETASLDNLQPLFAEGRSPWACVISILAITPWLFVGFDTIPQTAEEFNFEPSKSRRLMLNSIACGAILYALVLLSVAVIIPYTDLLGQNHTWTTGAVANMAFGKWGGLALAIPVMAGIFTGMNGFFMATTRLLFSMGRGKFLHPWFVQVHPKHGTPVNAVLFTLGLTLIAPWFGRSALNWIVDMSAMGTALAYLFTCMTAYKYVHAHPHIDEARWGKPVAVIGGLTAISCFCLLAIPGSPAAIGNESWIMLMIWVAIGTAFYLSRATELNAIPHTEMQYMLLGTADRPLLFDTREPAPVLAEIEDEKDSVAELS
ncbi:MAG: APC family permease [Bilophila sp.]